MTAGVLWFTCAAQADAAARGSSLAADTRGQPAATADDCMPAIGQWGRSFGIPPLLFNAIGLVESGRTDPKTGRMAPWPWTVNVSGTGSVFDNKADAIAAVQRAQASGIRSIDVGCMQINLMYHPDAFVDLENAFDPQVNAHYAALFLTRLHGMTGDWASAARAYHSMTPDLGAEYLRRVAAFWPPAAEFAAVATRTADSAARVDPLGVLTPEFRARLVHDAAERAARNLRMGLSEPSVQPAATQRGAASRRLRPAGQLQAAVGAAPPAN